MPLGIGEEETRVRIEHIAMVAVQDSASAFAR